MERSSSSEAEVARILPPITDQNQFFWTGGREGRLLILRGEASGRWIHPPESAAPTDGRLVPEQVSGRGTVFTFTVNHHGFHPLVPPPYVIALVELEEHPDIRIPTNIIGCSPDDVHIGMAVRVTFDQQGDHFVPLFVPEAVTAET